MQMLCASSFVTYDTVGHAGGQNHKYYLMYRDKTHIRKEVGFVIISVIMYMIES